MPLEGLKLGFHGLHDFGLLASLLLENGKLCLEDPQGFLSFGGPCRQRLQFGNARQ
jgi:hypothetical protein